MISDHVFRGERTCLYPTPTRPNADEFGLCGRPEKAHKESADIRSAPLPRRFIGFRPCVGIFRPGRRTEARSRNGERVTLAIALVFGVLIVGAAFGSAILDTVEQLVSAMEQ